MTKQIGRNPYIGKKLVELGYEGAVCVDYKEALSLGQHGVKIGHVGHLVQIPKQSIPKILQLKPEILTIYTVEKAEEIAEVAKELNVEVDLMLRVLDTDDCIYEGQNGGIAIEKVRSDRRKKYNVLSMSIFAELLHFLAFYIMNRHIQSKGRVI